MDMKKLALALAAFGGGVAALTGLAAALGRYRPADGGGGGDSGTAADRDETGGAFPLPISETPLTARQPADIPATLIDQPEGMAGAPRRPQPAPNPAAEHVPTDLLPDAPPVTIATRAPEAFRPDPTAVPTPEEREALRPATGPAPSLVADEGSGFAEAAGAA